VSSSSFEFFKEKCVRDFDLEFTDELLLHLRRKVLVVETAFSEHFEKN